MYILRNFCVISMLEYTLKNLISLYNYVTVTVDKDIKLQKSPLHGQQGSSDKWNGEGVKEDYPQVVIRPYDIRAYNHL